jgi:hypothetical protein
MTLLSIIQDAAVNIALSKPTSIVGNSEPQVIELLAALNSEGKHLVRDTPPLPQLQKQASFTTVAAEMQGALTDIAPDFGYAVRNTVWDRSKTWPLTGPLSPQEWQYVKARLVSGPFYQYRIMIDPATNKNSLYLYPTPPAGETFYFEYVSKHFVASSDLSTTYAQFGANDFDVGLIDEYLLQLGVEWRYLRTKGFDSWVQRKKDYDMYRGSVKGQDGGSSEFIISDALPKLKTGLIPPDGDWVV